MGRVAVASGGQRLVGRDDDLAAVTSALSSVDGGLARLVLVEGEPGIGKSELLRAVVDRLSPRFLVLSGHGHELDQERPFGIVADALRRERGIEVAWWSRGSRGAIEALARGEAHVAGAHLVDPRTGEPNGPWLRELVPFPCTRIAYANWEQGLLVPWGNPAGLTGIADIAQGRVRFVNREPGSGSRALLDEQLAAAGISSSEIAGYDTMARSHLAVGEAIAARMADAGVAIRAAGAAYGLDVIPLRTERYELIVPNHLLDLPAIGALLEVLKRPAIRAQVEAMQGYDAAGMGEPS
jgi:putative molybdopterin biosynthesis protein